MRRPVQLILLLLIATSAQAALSRTARGTANSKASGSTLTLSVTAAAGSSLIVSITDIASTVSSVAWNGASFSQDVTASVSSASVHIWSAHNVPAGTAQTMTVTWTLAIAARGVTVSEISGWAGQGVLDQTAGNTGSSVNADSGLTATTTDANEYLAGAIGVNGPTGDAAPTWLNSFSAGQRDGTTGGAAGTNATIDEGFQIVTATAQYKAAATLGTSRSWAAAIATYKNSGGAAVPVGGSKPNKLEAMDPAPPR